MKVGSAARTIDVAPGTNIQGALDNAGISAEGMQVSRNGTGSSLSAEVVENDVIMVNPKVTGGAR